MGSGVRGLEAPTLVDGHIHQHRTGLHQLQHVAGDEVRRLVARNQYRADHQVDGGQFRHDIVGR